MKRRMLVASFLALTVWMTACGTESETEPTESDGAGGYVESLGKAYHGGFAEGTRSDMQAISTALNARMIDAGGFPSGGDMEEMAVLLEPTYIRSVPREDAWGRPFRYDSNGDGFTLSSSGRNGIAGDDDDIEITDAGFR